MAQIPVYSFTHNTVVKRDEIENVKSVSVLYMHRLQQCAYKHESHAMVLGSEKAIYD